VSDGNIVFHGNFHQKQAERSKYSMTTRISAFFISAIEEESVDDHPILSVVDVARCALERSII